MVGFFVIVTDISDIRVRDSQIQLIMENMADAFVLHDSSGKVVYFNPATLTIFGLTEDELLGKTSHELGWRISEKMARSFR